MSKHRQGGVQGQRGISKEGEFLHQRSKSRMQGGLGGTSLQVVNK